LQPARDLDRVARIGRLQVELVLAVGIGRGDPGREKSGVLVQEIDGPEIGRGERTVRLRVGSIRKYSGVADVDAGLPAEFRSEADRVKPAR
jgi:hypothetical protein